MEILGVVRDTLYNIQRISWLLDVLESICGHFHELDCVE